MLELVEALQGTLDVRQAMVIAYPLLTQLIGVDYGALCVWYPSDLRACEWPVMEVPREWFRVYSAETEQYDSVLQASMQSPNQVLRDSEILPHRELERNLLYRRCHDLSVPFEHVMGVVLDMKSDWYGGVALYRDRRAAFSGHEKRILQRLTQAFALAIRNYRIFNKIKQKGGVLEALLCGKGIEAVVYSFPGPTEVARTEGLTELCARWFSAPELRSDGIPSIPVDRLVHLVRAPDVPGQAVGWSKRGWEVDLQASASSRLPAGSHAAP